MQQGARLTAMPLQSLHQFACHQLACLPGGVNRHGRLGQGHRSRLCQAQPATKGAANNSICFSALSPS